MRRRQDPSARRAAPLGFFMRLFIAEKPSLARAIADGLPGPARPSRHHIACGEGNVVAWCAGHILRTAPPEAYGPDCKAWRLERLPIVPRDWKVEVAAPDLLQSIRTLLAQASSVVHAGDPDREGQLLVDEVLAFLRYRGPVERLLVHDLRPESVRRQLARLEPNAKYRPLSDAALARQRADWLYGMNMTRLYTGLGRAAGYDGVLSVGRVQTPLLGLIVARDRAIAEFRSVRFYAISLTLRTGGGESFRALWIPGPGMEAHLDDEKRLLSQQAASAMCERVRGQKGAVSTCTRVRQSEPPPLPYALADLQVDAGRRLRLSAQAVLDTCQSLYEAHRLTTYPRSDCAHLPEGHFAQAPEVVRAIVRQAPSLASAAAGADLSLRSKAWNDTKVTAHHAIIPTPAAGAATARLSDRERAVYELISCRYLAQFYPPHEYVQTELTLDIAGERFVARGREAVAVGWKALLKEAPDDTAPSTELSEKPSADSDATKPLPRLAEGEVIAVTDATVAEKKTQPPKPFTDASLIAAMCGVAKFVSDPRVKKILSESDGIGTPATRAAIIETLFTRGFVSRSKNAIVATDTGRALVACLPPVATTPDRTALWEAALRAIADGTGSLEAFLAHVGAELTELVVQGRAQGSIAVPATASSPRRSPPQDSGRPRKKAR